MNRNELSFELAKEVAAIYELAEADLTERVARRLMRGINEDGYYERKLAEIQDLRREMRRHIERMQREGVSALTDATERGYFAGRGDVDKELSGDPLLNIRRMPTRTNTRAIRAIARAIAEESGNLFAASHATLLRSTEDNYRSIISKAAKLAATGAITRQTATRRALYEFAERGIAQFIDKAGRKWGMQEYAEMATRTAITRAYVQGSIDRYKDDGRDLVIVSNSPEECELCRPWEGKILSLSGRHYDQPVGRELPHRVEPDVPPLPAVGNANPKALKAARTKKVKLTPEEEYLRLTDEIENNAASLNRMDIELSRLGRGREYDALLRERTALKAKIARDEKKRTKLGGTLKLDGVGGNAFDVLDPQAQIDRITDALKQTSKEERDYLERLKKLQIQGKRDTAEYKTLRTQYEILALKRKNANNLAIALKEQMVLSSPTEIRPGAKPGSWADKTQQRIAKSASTEKDMIEIGRMVRKEFAKRIERRWGKDLPKGNTEFSQSVLRDELLKLLRELRHMGPGAGVNGEAVKYRFSFDSNQDAIVAVENAMHFFPHAWNKASTERGWIRTQLVRRAYYYENEGGTPEMNMSADPKRRPSTAVHEMSHRFESVNRRIVEFEREFYERRTKDERLVKLKDVYGGGYRDNEETRLDKFLSPYMGKDYGGYAYELLSMGVEHVFFFNADLEHWAKDEDYLEFILGLLAAA